jgi:ribonucleoside-diphosphate reductase alpha chain
VIDLHQPSPFIELAAVEAWDAWFRWREQTDLRDVSIEDTWLRVSSALASVEPRGETAMWQARFMDALASWRLLPDERLLTDAGTGRPMRYGGGIHAALNAASFVSFDRGNVSALDLAALSECAMLTVRALDNVALLATVAAPRLHIGLLGVADALALLGLAYDSDAGRVQAASMANALAQGCLRGNMLLAITRGAVASDTPVAFARAQSRGTSADLLRDIARHGLRHAQLTAIAPHPRLALLANDVADAVDPLRGEDHPNVIAVPGGQRRTIRSSGYALNVLQGRGNGSGEEPDTLANLPWTAQIAMRAAVQPWIDEPIDYPLLTTSDLDDARRLEAQKLAASHGLGDPAWRDSAELQAMWP